MLQIFGKDNQQTEITQLKQQLEEKEKEIDIISRDNNSYKYNIDEQKRIIDDFAKQLKEKDNYHLRYKLAGADETITNLRQQLAEKQNTIDEINKEFVQAIHDWKALCAEKDKEIEKLKITKNNAIECADLFKVALSVRQKDLAIQELEKVKEEMDLNGNSYCEIRQGTSPHNPTDYAWFNYVKFRKFAEKLQKEYEK